MCSASVVVWVLLVAPCRLAGFRYVFSKSARLALFRVLLAAPFLLCVSGLAVVVAALCRWWPLLDVGWLVAGALCHHRRGWLSIVGRSCSVPVF